MTDQPSYVVRPDIAVTPDVDPAGARPSWAEIAEAVATSEEVNTADEIYAAELAALSGAAPADTDEVARVDIDGTDSSPVAEPEPEAEPAGEPAPEVAGAEPEPEAEPAAEPPPGDAAAEPEPERAVETEPAPEAATAEPESEPDLQAATEPEPEVAAGEPAPEVATAEPEPEPQPEPSVQPEPEPEPELHAATEPEPEAAAAEPTPEPQREAATELGPEAAAAEPIPEAQAAAAEPTPEAQAAAGEPTPEAQAATEPVAEPATEPEPEVALADASPATHVVPGPGAAPRVRPGQGRPGAPGGRPGQGPGRPTPIPRQPAAGRPTHTLPVVVEQQIEASDPTPWGRVEEDGTVYVTTADGERAVGFWQAGDPASGLAHYGRRYDDFITEIVVLEVRVAGRSGDLKATKAHAAMLRQSIDTLPAVGDLAGAAARLDAVLVAADEALAAAAQDRATVRAAALARREALCVEAEELAESNQWKTSGDRLKEIVEEWRTIRGLDRRTDDQLWKRFSKARDTFIRRRGSHFAELDKERAAAKEVKEKLIARAEELSDSSDWAGTAGEYRNLMTEWKAAGRTSRDVEDALWVRFRDAQERFFSRRQQTFASRDAEYESNATSKEALLAEAERIDPAAGLDAAKAALRSVQSRWESAGKVPRERIRSLDARLRAVEDKIKSAEDSHWRKTDPEATARLAQFRSRYESYQAQADKAKASGDTRRAAAAQAQADQWLEWLKAAENAVE